MTSDNKTKRYSIFLSIAAVGAAWGIFEATVGYLLHLISFSYSWLIWYPVACFFMANVYRKTGRVSSVFFVGLLCASIKMLNLLLPGRIDKVINPAISIVFEALSMAAVILAVHHFYRANRKKPYIKALMALAMNTGWRLLFILYLLFLVPDWMREISVISSSEKFIPFFITQNLITSALLLIGYQFMEYIFSLIKALEQKISTTGALAPVRTKPILKTGIVAVMLCIDIALELLL